jgi:hypothetical protein
MQKNKVINNLTDLPAGYFRIHWPQYQILMDDENYDEDVIFCDGECEIEGLPTIALPYSYLKRVEDELGQKTRFYFEFINQKFKLN